MAAESYLFSDAELTLAVEDGLQCNRTHPFGQDDNKVLRPVPLAPAEVTPIGAGGSPFSDFLSSTTLSYCTPMF